MKQIRFFLTLVLLFSFLHSLIAQNNEDCDRPLQGSYHNNHRVEVKFTRGARGRDMIHSIKCDSKELEKILSDLNRLTDDIKRKDDQIKKLQGGQNQSQNQSQNQGQNPKIDSVSQQIVALRLDKLKLEGQRDSLQERARLLQDTIRLLRDSLEKVNNLLADLSQRPSAQTGTFQHVGAYYRLGSPLLFNKTLKEKFWNRQITSSHQIGLYWNSASFSDKFPMTYGAGLELSWMRFSAGTIGQLQEEFDTTDADGADYRARFTYNNVKESATLCYLGIPLSFSIGAPRADRISGYFQVSLVPSFLLFGSLGAIRDYSQSGHYSYLHGTPVDFTLENYPDLHFGTYRDTITFDKTKATSMGFVLSGRLSGGVYIPLCNTAEGQISQWLVKVGVNLDLATCFAKKTKDLDEPQYRHDQYNTFSGAGSRYINPSLEVGILYIFNH